MLKVDHLSKAFQAGGSGKRADGTVRALCDVSFEVGEGEFFALLGPSGCGKTTTLRSVAGLEDPDNGSIVLGGKVLFDSGPGRRVNVPARERGLGMVFQSYAIWPHMRTFDNVAFPLAVTPRGARLRKTEIRDRVMRVLEMMDLAALAERPATDLSGGQQQRVALARAIVTEPPLLLLDEPLSNLDAQLRTSLRFEFKRLQRELGVTTIYVTHDQSEALALSSTIAVMQNGEVMQLGTPRELYEHPNDAFVAGFLGISNLLTGVVEATDGRVVTVRCSGGVLAVPLPEGDSIPATGAAVTVVLRPEAITVKNTRNYNQGVNEWRGNILTYVYLGHEIECLVQVGKEEIQAHASSGAAFDVGADVHLSLEPSKVLLVAMPAEVS